MAESIVQYIILRTDLKWPLGAIAAQACHASIAAIHLFKDEKETVEYLEELDRMHKVVLEDLVNERSHLPQPIWVLRILGIFVDQSERSSEAGEIY
ncbi:hypothetical protein QYM36_004152 [Artemia franciscana]|nr:hypothetical protein QYM36_004152 [Artemia franciscana]